MRNSDRSRVVVGVKPRVLGLSALKKFDVCHWCGKPKNLDTKKTCGGECGVKYRNYCSRRTYGSHLPKEKPFIE